MNFRQYWSFRENFYTPSPGSDTPLEHWGIAVDWLEENSGSKETVDEFMGIVTAWYDNIAATVKAAAKGMNSRTDRDQARRPVLAISGNFKFWSQELPKIVRKNLFSLSSSAEGKIFQEVEKSLRILRVAIGEARQETRERLSGVYRWGFVTNGPPNWRERPIPDHLERAYHFAQISLERLTDMWQRTLPLFTQARQTFLLSKRNKK